MLTVLENMTREELLEANKQLLLEKQSLESEKQSLESDVQHLQFQLDQIKRMLFGSKRERFISNEHHDQLSLPFDTPQTESKEKEPETENISYSRRKKNRDNHPGRLSLPDHLPVEEIVLEPEEDVTGMKCIGKEVTEQLELTPARLFVIRYVRYKFVKPEDEGLQTFKGVIADLPVFPIEKGIAGSGLLSQIMVDKYVDHLPIYRQVQRFARDNVRIPSNTINGWQDKVSRLIAPLYDRQVRLVTGQGYLQVDETPIKVLDKDVKGKCHQGYYWVYNSPIQNAVVFDYQKGRGRDGPKKMLSGFKGYLQSDGYHVYDWFGKKKQITLINCWAHVRRYFEKALQYDKKIAEYVLTEIQKLYAIERFARKMELLPNERKELRLDHALPILNELGKWMAENLKKHLPKSPVGQALQYTIPRWDNLLAYLYDGHLEIDNNLIESR